MAGVAAALLLGSATALAAPNASSLNNGQAYNNSQTYRAENTGMVQNGSHGVKPAPARSASADRGMSDSACDAQATHSMVQQGLRNTNC